MALGQISNWFREIIRDKIRARYTSMGGYLDGMFERGDGGAGNIKFPVVGGDIQMYELTGALQEIDASQLNEDMVQVQVRDFEAAAYLRIQDERKCGPQQQQSYADKMAIAVRKKRDFLKIDALVNFAAAGSSLTLTDAPSAIEVIGDGSAAITVEDAVYIGDSIVGTGTDKECWCLIPYSWMSQLNLTKWFANSQYQGPTDLPLARSSKIKTKTFQGVNFVALPNDYFYTGTGKNGTGSGGQPFDPTGYIDTFAWCTDAVGAEIEWNQEDMTMTPQPQLKGTPTLCKVQLSGNAVGIIPEGVKKIRMKAISRATAATP
jgi:hypothetical protein